MRLHVVPGLRFTCQSCAACCRDWHVELTAEEASRIPALDWPQDDPLRGAVVIHKRHGRTYLAHRRDGACIFLNPENNLCRIHEKHGEMAKPLGCRLFPFHIAPTFEGEATVIARCDCPTVRRNEGQPVEEQRRELNRLAGELNIQGGFDEETRCMLTQTQIEMAVEFALTLMNGFESDDQRALFLCLYTAWLSEQSVESLSRSSLGEGFAVIKSLVEQSASVLGGGATTGTGAGNLSGAHRLAFRAFLAMHLRRDEDVLHGRASRLGRVTATALMSIGRGNLRRLGASHPSASIANARLFHGGHRFEQATTCAALWRTIRGRLASYQFMGAGNGGRNFIVGLRSLTLVYPLTIAAAKVIAAARNSETISTGDIDAALAMIDHAHGRSPALATPMARRVESMLVQPVVYSVLALRL